MKSDSTEASRKEVNDKYESEEKKACSIEAMKTGGSCSMCEG
jgi:hypothetical protein